MGENEPGHRSCSEHIPTEFLVQREQEMEDSIGLPVVNGFQMVELGSFKDIMKNHLFRSLYQRLTGVHKVLCSAA